MLALLTAAAFAQVPPDVDLQDVLGWEAAAEKLLDGPPGCFEMVGQATWAWDIGRFGGSAGDVAFLGRLDDGVWSSVHLEPMGELLREKGDRRSVRVYGREARFAPLVGKLVGARVTIANSDGTEVEGDLEQNAKATNVLRRAMDRISSHSETSWAEWDASRQGVVLHRAVALDDGRRPPEAEVTVFFPGGRDVPTELDVSFPAKFFEGRIPAWRISDAEVHIRGQAAGDRVFPATESFKFDFGILGFRFSGAQTIQYTRATRCSDSGSEQPVVEPMHQAPATDDAATAEGAG